MTATQLLNHKIEYETTDISLPSLCTKYSIKKDQLKDCLTWKKENANVIVGEQELYPRAIQDTKTDQDYSETEQSFLEDITKFKRLAIKHALHAVKDAQYLEVKEFKDLVSIMDTIEKSVLPRDEDSQTNINIAIQNMARKYNDDI